MIKLIFITLLSTLSLWATMYMQTIQTKKIVVGTFNSNDTLNHAKQLLAGNKVLQRIQQQNNFIMTTTRTNTGATTLILEKFKTMRMALDAFVAVSKHYPKAYLLDDNYKVAMEVPPPSPQPPQPVTPVIEKSTLIPVVPTITEAVVTAAATAEIAKAPAPETLSQTVESEPEITEKDEEPIIIVVTEAGSEAERRAIEKALEANTTPAEQPQQDNTAEEEAEEEVVVTEIEEIPLDEPNTTQELLPTTAASTTNTTLASASTIDEERYKRKPKEETPLVSLSTLIYILLAVISLLLLLLWRRSRDVDVHKILGEQHRH